MNNACLVTREDIHQKVPLAAVSFVKLIHHESMKTFSALLALCEGNPPVTDGSPSQRPVTPNFDVFYDLRLNKRLSKQSKHRWFETSSRSLWRHSNDWRIALLVINNCYSRQATHHSLYISSWLINAGDKCPPPMNILNVGDKLPNNEYLNCQPWTMVMVIYISMGYDMLLLPFLVLNYKVAYLPNVLPWLIYECFLFFFHSF